MLGLGSNLTKGGAGAKTITTDGLVLKHNYTGGAVQPLSDGAAFFVSSADDYVTMGDASDLSFGAGSFSVAAWVNTNQTGVTRQFLGKRSGIAVANQGFSLYLGNSGTDWVFNVADGTDYIAVTTTTEANANQWYHVCGTFDGTAKTAKLYVDGVLIATTTNTDVGDLDVSNDLIIGGGSDSTSSQKWDGYVCNAGTWNAVLTQAQIKSIMNKNYAGLSDSEKTDLVSWWNLDSVIPELTTAVYDNHHGGGEVLGSEGVDYPSDVATATEPFELDTTTSLYTYNKSLSGTGRLTFGTAVAAQVGQVYEIVIDITISSGNANVAFKSANSATTLLNYTDLVDGVNTFYSTVTGVNGNVNRLFTSSANTDNSFTLNSVSVKKINGNTGTLS